LIRGIQSSDCFPGNQGMLDRTGHHCSKSADNGYIRRDSRSGLAQTVPVDSHNRCNFQNCRMQKRDIPERMIQVRRGLKPQKSGRVIPRYVSGVLFLKFSADA